MASKDTLYRRMAADADEQRAEHPAPPHPAEGRPQSEALQAMLKREFLAAYDRGPILTPRVVPGFAAWVGHRVTQKDPSAFAYLFSAATPALQKRREAQLPPSAAAATEIESEAPT